MGDFSKYHFLLRKLHQFVGVMPLGVYLIIHLLINSYAMQGATAFENKVQLVESMPFLPLVEALLIFIPLIYHAIFGIWVGFIAKNNPLRFPYARNWNFTLQRLTGFFMLVFLGYHAWFMRFQGTPIGTLEGHAGYLKVVDHLASPMMAAFYVVGVLACTYHFANGLWEFLIDWGFTVSMKAQFVSSLAMILVWLGVSALGLASLYAFRHPVSPVYSHGTTHVPVSASTVALEKEVVNGR